LLAVLFLEKRFFRVTMKRLLISLLLVGVVGCGKSDQHRYEVAVESPAMGSVNQEAVNQEAFWVSDPTNPNNVKIEMLIRRQVNKPTGELTPADLQKVTILSLRSNQLTDVKGLENLAKLEVLFLAHNQLTDVKNLEQLKKLVGVDLTDNPDLTKAQIAELQKALPHCDITSNPSLGKEESTKLIEADIRDAIEKPTGELTKADLEKVTEMFLSDYELTDVTCLGKLAQLSNLDLHNNRLSDLKGIEMLTQLKDLNLRNNQLPDLKGIEMLTQLKYLDLFNNRLTDVKSLQNLTQLTSLNLGNNQLTDVTGLERLKQLEFLSLLRNNAITKAQIAELRKALPECLIISP